jgi:hypothetical protein
MSHPKPNRRQRRQSLKLNAKTALPAPSAKKTEPLTRRKKKASRVSIWRWINPLFLWKLVSPPVRWATGIFTFAITAATTIPMLTKVQINSGAATDKTSPWPGPFVVSNDGVFPVYNLKWTITPIVTHFQHSQVRWKDTIWENQGPSYLDALELNSGQKITLFLLGDGQTVIPIAGDTLQDGVFDCSIAYDNVLHWRQKQESRFRCILRSNGEYEWMPYDDRR